MKTSILLKISLMAMAITAISFSSFATVHTITVQNYSFTPSSLPDVHIGDTIRWVWVNGSHTTTSTTIPAGAASWDHPLNSSSTSFDYSPSIAGTYDYKCTPHASMGMTASFTVVEAQGLGDKASPVSISIYPNPFYEDVTVKFSSSGSSAINQIRIYDITGRMVAMYDFPLGQTDFEKEISSATLPAGLLFFEFRGTDGKVYIRRVIRE